MSGVGKYESGVLRQLPNPIFLQPHKCLWGVGTAAQVGTNGRVFLTAFYTPFPISITKIDVALTVLGGVGTHIRFGLYSVLNQQIPTPDGGLLLFDSGDINADSVTNKDISVTPSVIVNGWFFMAMETNDAVVQFTRTIGTVVYTEQSSTKLRGARFDQAYGALPATVPATTTDDTANVISSIVFV